MNIVEKISNLIKKIKTKFKIQKSKKNHITSTSYTSDHFSRTSNNWNNIY